MTLIHIGDPDGVYGSAGATIEYCAACHASTLATNADFVRLGKKFGYSLNLDGLEALEAIDVVDSPLDFLAAESRRECE